jgi:ElaB/YqjD/DUF883 family membrane-anchored ribosome-binding protein
MGFAESMKAFADEVVQCAHARTEAVAEIHQDAQEVLGAARSFMARVSQEHQERASHVQTTLAEGLRDRREQVRNLRQAINQRLNEVREQTEAMLTETRRQRDAAVGELMTTFRKDRTDLSQDLREAGQFWRNRGAS